MRSPTRNCSRSASRSPSALAHAHARGVIHRDVKPQNVLVPHEPDERGGVAKLADFGGARLTGEDALTRTGDVLGTLAYMAPEQSEGHEAGEPADLYALALVLYEGLSGVNPVRGATPAATARRIGSRLEPLERRRGDLPALAHARDRPRARCPSPSSGATLEDLHLALEEALVRGLKRPPWRPPPRAPCNGASREAAADPEAGLRSSGEPAHEPTRRSADPQSSSPASPGRADRDLPGGGGSIDPARRLALPRAVWLGCALAAIVWLLATGRPGAALLLLAAAAPLVLLPRRSGLGWLTAALAPVLGLVGLAGAFPALAGQRARLAERAALARARLLVADPRRAAAGPTSVAGRPRRYARAGGLGGVAEQRRRACGRPQPEPRRAVRRGRLGRWPRSCCRGWCAGAAPCSTWSPRAPGRWRCCSPAHPTTPGYTVSVVSATPRGAVLGALLGGALAVAARALRGPV